MRERFVMGSLVAQRALIVAGAFLLASSTIGGAYTLKTRHTFCQNQGCPDGSYPETGLIMDQTGAVYGTTTGGGVNGDYGVAFRLTISDHKITYARLHSFCKKTNCSDGQRPNGVLVIDTQGNLYGTAPISGQSHRSGLVFELSPSGSGWKYTVLYRFCSQPNCADGGEPGVGLAYEGQSTGAPWDGASPLYGTTFIGGKYDNGVVYQLTRSGSVWTQTAIHNFQSSSYPNNLLVDSSGNIFGTTSEGGKYGGGLMFKLSFSNGSWSTSVLHNFCNQTNCADGSFPVGLMVMDASGNLYGTTQNGGSGQECGGNAGCGVVFERGAGGTYSVLYNFCSVNQCVDGLQPNELLVESSGNLLGGAFYGGSANSGVFFELVNNAGSWSETVLYNFCSQTGCTDGQYPGGGLLMNAAGDIWGTSLYGGSGKCTYGCGTVFEFVP